MAEDRMRITVRDAKIILRNFEGRGMPMNQAGNRNFCVVLTPEVAEQMVAVRWNVKQGRPTEDGEERNPFIQVTVKYRDINGKPVKPPRIVVYSAAGPRLMTEETISNLDYVDIAKADVIFQSREYGGDTLKAYCKTLVIWLDEDELEIEHGLNSNLGKTVTPEEVEGVDGGE